MVITRSQSGTEENQGRVFDEPPRSPSNATCIGPRGEGPIDAPPPTASRTARADVRPSTSREAFQRRTLNEPPNTSSIGQRGEGPAEAPPTASHPAVRTQAGVRPSTVSIRDPSRTRLTAAAETPIASGTRSRTARSARSTASAVARLHYEAEERLAAIRRKELEIEAQLVKSKLAADLIDLENDSGPEDGNEPTENIDRIHAWLDETVPSPAAATREEPIARQHPTLGPAEFIEPVQATAVSTPMNRRARFDWTAQEPAQDREPRRRSPTPRSRGIEQLASTLEKMMSSRPPPRQTTDLPIFSGAPSEWIQFAAAMKETTKLYKFTATENLARLRNCLRGEARATAAPLLSAGTDPDIVMKTLEQCFGRPELLVDLAFEDIKRLPRLGLSTVDLNTFAVKVQNIVAVLSNVERGYLQNPLLIREVLEKLSPHIRSRWYDYAEDHPSADAEITKLSAFLMREADRALKHGFSISNQVKREPPRPTSRTEVKKKTVYTTTTPDDDNEKCPACEETHTLPSCQKFKQMQLDERWEIVKREGLCFKCITSRHRRSNCKKRTCGMVGCKLPHHRLLHRATAREPTAETDTNNTVDAKKESAVVTAASTRGDVKLKICAVTVTGVRGSMETYALFDEGSTITLIDEDLARQIGAHGPASRLEVKGINGERRDTRSRRVSLAIKGTHNRKEFDIAARTMSNLDLTPQSIPAELLKLRHLSTLEADEVVYDNAKPKLLIGTDNWPLIVTRELRFGKPKEPAASRTELGWVIHGITPNATSRQKMSVLHIAANPTDDEQLQELVANHFEIDALGVSTTSRHIKDEDVRAVKIFEETVRYKDGHYEVGLPWRNDGTKLPPSYNAALKRLTNLEAKLSKDPNEKEQYHAKMRSLVEKGYAEQCNGTEMKSPVAWYLPHFAVRNPNKPGKIRVVLDAAARTHGTCLNDHLLQGPDMLRSLIAIMFRFREGKYAVTADIEEMFLRVKIRQEDQPAQMFLWREHPTDAPTCYKMTSMIFGASSSPFLAHSVRDNNARVHQSTHPAALRPITESHYMDDFVESFSDLKQAREVIRQVDEVHKLADFHLRGWNSNDRELLSNIKSERQAEATTTQLGGTEKMLGLLWTSSTDDLSFNTALNRVPEAVRTRERPPTKREALSTVMSIYDPLGLLACYTITAKILLQRLWRTNTKWDESISEDIACDFDIWLEGLHEVKCLRIPRCYDGGREVRRRELHVFCDASEEAYATVAYWRLQLKDGETKVALIAARAKVAPLKTQTMPRLELQAALIGTRLAKTIMEDHRIQVDDVIYWSDSQVVLHWLRNGSRKYTPFVAHRLGEIRESSKSSDWRWVPTNQNIADVATRGGHIPKDGDEWFVGPNFLSQPKSEWPRWEGNQEDTQQEEVHVIINTERNPALPNIDRFSTYDRLIGATARVLLFPERCRDRKTRLSQSHITKATHLWLKQAQEESFEDELRNIQKGDAVSKTSPLYRYDIIMEDGLLKINGRANKADAPIEVKRPIILNGRHPLTKLIISRAHKRAGHANLEQIVNDLRQQYFIIRLRPTAKSIAAACQTCRLRKKHPTEPPVGDLPKERLQAFQRPFSHCGIDYFGPMTVTIGRRHEKRWGALFTCLTTRAIHLELVASLSTDSAIMAIRRMAARRGWPTVIYSDNGTNFRGADVELKKAYEEWQPELEQTGFTYGTTWKYIAPGAPNQGGAWERMVRSVKTALSTTLNEKAPKEEVLATLLAEAEYTVNSRPLTHVSVDPADPEAITPNHFLLGSSAGLPYTGPCEEANRRTWKIAQTLADHFWRRWLREYLPTLVPRLNNHKHNREVKTGDVVVIADSSLPRNVWPKGIITHTFPGPDGITRNVEVSTKGGNFRRPTSKIIVLESSPAPSPDQREGMRCNRLSS